MLNGSDVQLFYKLLDSLSNSLRDLAINYQLLLKESSEREKITSAVTTIAKEISVSFASMSNDINSLKSMTSDNSKTIDQILAAGQASLKMAENLDHKVTQMIKELGEVSSSVVESHNLSKHLDSHMDAQVGELLGISQRIPSVISSVDEMKKDFAPIKKLSIILSKPVAIILGVYFIVITILGVMKGCDEYKKVAVKSNEFINSVSNKP